jgi:hypothetical protein
MVAAAALVECGIMAWEARDADEALLVLEEHPRIGLVFTEQGAASPICAPRTRCGRPYLWYLVPAEGISDLLSIHCHIGG